MIEEGIDIPFLVVPSGVMVSVESSHRQGKNLIEIRSIHESLENLD